MSACYLLGSSSRSLRVLVSVCDSFQDAVGERDRILTGHSIQALWVRANSEKDSRSLQYRTFVRRRSLLTSQNLYQASDRPLKIKYYVSIRLNFGVHLQSGNDNGIRVYCTDHRLCLSLLPHNCEEINYIADAEHARVLKIASPSEIIHFPLRKTEYFFTRRSAMSQVRWAHTSNGELSSASAKESECDIILTDALLRS
jgi:hypothetical protein